MEQKGILIVVSGFSGAGKGTLMKGLLEIMHFRFLPQRENRAREKRKERRIFSKKLKNLKK